MCTDGCATTFLRGPRTTHRPMHFDKSGGQINYSIVSFLSRLCSCPTLITVVLPQERLVYLRETSPSGGWIFLLRTGNDLMKQDAEVARTEQDQNRSLGTHLVAAQCHRHFPHFAGPFLRAKMCLPHYAYNRRTWYSFSWPKHASQTAPGSWPAGRRWPSAGRGYTAGPTCTLLAVFVSPLASSSTVRYTHITGRR